MLKRLVRSRVGAGSTSARPRRFVLFFILFLADKKSSRGRRVSSNPTAEVVVPALRPLGQATHSEPPRTQASGTALVPLQTYTGPTDRRGGSSLPPPTSFGGCLSVCERTSRSSSSSSRLFFALPLEIEKIPSCLSCSPCRSSATR